MKTLQKERDFLAGLSKTPFKDELFLNNLHEKYNVTSLRNGKRVVWNKKPLEEKDAIEMVKQLERAKIPSVDINSIQMVVSPAKKSSAKAEVDNKKSDKRKSEAITWVNNIKDESTALLTEVQRMPVVDKAQVKLILNWVELIEGAINNIKKGLK